MQAPLTVPPSLLTQTSSTKLVLRFAEQPAQYHLSTPHITRSRKSRGGSPIFTICDPWRAARITRRFIVSRQSGHDTVDLPKSLENPTAELNAHVGWQSVRYERFSARRQWLPHEITNR